MELKHARTLAAEVAQYMQPYCERIQVAGSIRRLKQDVGDIELVCIPKWEERPAMGFGEQSLLFTTATTQRMVGINLLHEAMMKRSRDDLIRIEWIKPGTSVIEPWPIKSDGKYWRGLVAGAVDNGPLQKIKLDVFIARPENYGVILTIRTGSADFSRALVTYARDHTEYRVNGGYLVTKNNETIVACPEEVHLFDFLDLKWLEPHLRRSDRDVRPVG